MTALPPARRRAAASTPLRQPLPLTGSARNPLEKHGDRARQRPASGRSPGSSMTSPRQSGNAQSVAGRRHNLEAHRRVVEAVNAREVPDGLLAPGFRMVNRLSAVTDYQYQGAIGLRDWMNDVFEVFAEGASYEVEEILAAGDDYVAARFCMSGRGGRSQMPLEFRWAGVTWFRGGRALRAIGYASSEEALKALDVDRGSRSD